MLIASRTTTIRSQTINFNYGSFIKCISRYTLGALSQDTCPVPCLEKDQVPSDGHCPKGFSGSGPRGRCPGSGRKCCTPDPTTTTVTTTTPTSTTTTTPTTTTTTTPTTTTSTTTTTTTTTPTTTTTTTPTTTTTTTPTTTTTAPPSCIAVSKGMCTQGSCGKGYSTPSTDADCPAGLTCCVFTPDSKSMLSLFTLQLKARVI